MVPSASTDTTARTRSSNGHHGGSPISSSSFTSAAPPSASAAATPATSSGPNPSDGLMMAPTAFAEEAGNDGPGNQEPTAEPRSRSISRHRVNARVSTPSPATNADRIIGRLAPQFDSGNSKTARP